MTEGLTDFVRGLQLAVEPTDSDDFASRFRSTPAEALEAKGIMLSEDARSRLNDQVAELATRSPGEELAATEVEVSVKIKF